MNLIVVAKEFFCSKSKHAYANSDMNYYIIDSVTTTAVLGVSSHWTGIWNGTVEWKMEWKSYCTQ